MTYSQLLQDIRWKNKRLLILDRDKNKCTHCLNRSYLEELKSTRFLLGRTSAKAYIKFTDTFGFAEVDIERHRLAQLMDKERNYNYCLHDKCCEVYAILSFNKQFGESIPDNIENLRWIYVRSLHVHHKYYQEGLMPWEYLDEALITLCGLCHDNLHKREKVPYLDVNGKVIKTLIPCKKCMGNGLIPQFSHVQGGVCFECLGSKYINL